MATKNERETIQDINALLRIQRNNLAARELDQRQANFDLRKQKYMDDQYPNVDFGLERVNYQDAKAAEGVNFSGGGGGGMAFRQAQTFGGLPKPPSYLDIPINQQPQYFDLANQLQAQQQPMDPVDLMKLDGEYEQLKGEVNKTLYDTYYEYAQLAERARSQKWNIRQPGLDPNKRAVSEHFYNLERNVRELADRLERGEKNRKFLLEKKLTQGDVSQGVYTPTTLQDVSDRDIMIEVEQYNKTLDELTNKADFNRYKQQGDYLVKKLRSMADAARAQGLNALAEKYSSNADSVERKALDRYKWSKLDFEKQQEKNKPVKGLQKEDLMDRRNIITNALHYNDLNAFKNVPKVKDVYRSGDKLVFEINGGTATNPTVIKKIIDPYADNAEYAMNDILNLVYPNKADHATSDDYKRLGVTFRNKEYIPQRGNISVFPNKNLLTKIKKAPDQYVGLLQENLPNSESRLVDGSETVRIMITGVDNEGNISYMNVDTNEEKTVKPSDGEKYSSVLNNLQPNEAVNIEEGQYKTSDEIGSPSKLFFFKDAVYGKGEESKFTQKKVGTSKEPVKKASTMSDVKKSIQGTRDEIQKIGVDYFRNNSKGMGQ